MYCLSQNSFNMFQHVSTRWYRWSALIGVGWMVVPSGGKTCKHRCLGANCIKVALQGAGLPMSPVSILKSEQLKIPKCDDKGCHKSNYKMWEGLRMGHECVWEIAALSCTFCQFIIRSWKYKEGLQHPFVCNSLRCICMDAQPSPCAKLILFLWVPWHFFWWCSSAVACPPRAWPVLTILPFLGMWRWQDTAGLQQVYLGLLNPESAMAILLPFDDSNGL